MGDILCKFSHRWYAVNTQPHVEHRAVTNLSFQGFSAFFPCRLKTTKHARQFRTVSAPLFPGYVFVRLNINRDRWRAVNGTLGVRSLVMTGDMPAPVPNGLVEALMTMRDKEGFINFASELQVGQQVRMLAGPFAEMVGQLEWLDEAGRVRVLLNLLGGEVRVRARADTLVPV